MDINTALLIADTSINSEGKLRKPIDTTDEELVWALRVLAGAYRRQKEIIKKSRTFAAKDYQI